jgi:molecular chaperone GrpE
MNNSTQPENEDNLDAENNVEHFEDFAEGEDDPVESLASTDMPEAPAQEANPLEAEVADLKDKLLRTLAENENIRKRAEKERNDTAKFAVGNFAKQLLSVADNLRRALDAIPEETRQENDGLNNIFVGVEATERELLRAFDAVGIKQIDALDQPFNPNFHEVMMEMEAPDKPSGTVVQVLETGYMIHDRLLRPARVCVSKGGPKAEKKVNEEV